MALYRVGPLPDGALAAAARFHGEELPKVLALLVPLRNGEVAARSADGGAEASQQDIPLAEASRPLYHPADGPPPRSGEDLVLLFQPADHTHRAWRLAVVQQLAREYAPLRVNALESDDEAATTAALAYLGTAEGVTGQLLPLDGTGAGKVLS